MSEMVISRETFDRACRELKERGENQSPALFGQQIMVIALYSAQVARKMELNSRLLPYPHVHEDGMTCNDCEDVRLHNERIAAGG